MPQIELTNVSKVYEIGGEQIRAVDNVSLKIEKGEFLSIVGHSGSGKTTLLSIIGGAVKPSSGRVLFDGSDICSLGDTELSRYRNENIGFMFQFASLLPVLTARENVLLPALFRQNGKPDIKRADEYLDLVGLADKIHAFPSQLSGGQQRRVAIVRALMNGSELLLADEPTGDLDEETEADIMKLFRKINQEQMITFLFITHNLDLAGHAQRQLRMTHGLIQEL